MIALKGQVFNNFYLGRMRCLERTDFWINSTLGGCDGLVRIGSG